MGLCIGYPRPLGAPGHEVSFSNILARAVLTTFSACYIQPRPTCRELKALLDPTRLDYRSLITDFKISETLADPRKFCLAQTSFALIVFAMNGIQRQIPGLIVEPVTDDQGIYHCSEGTGQGILSALWLALGELVEGEVRKKHRT